MKTTRLIIMMIFALNVVTVTAAANEADKIDEAAKAYVNVQYAIGYYDDDIFKEANPTLLVGSFGKFFSKNLH